jgi:MFS transporter, putative metabolite:H+ symporter
MLEPRYADQAPGLESGPGRRRWHHRRILRGVGTFSFLSNPIVPLSLLMVGSTAVISILLPYAAENYPIRVRGRATGWVAGWSKIGGLIAQGLGALALVPALGSAAAIVALPAMMALVLIAVAGHETPCADCRRWARDTWPGSSRT